MISVRNQKRRSGKDLPVQAANHQDKPVRKVRFPLDAVLLGIVLILLTGCTVIANDEVPGTSTLTATTSLSVDDETISKVEVTPTLTPMHASTIAPTPTATAYLENDPVTSTPEPEHTPDEHLNWENDQLITFGQDGIYRFALDTENIEEIITREDEWQLFYAKISYDGKQVVYWYVEDGMFQVWVVNTIDGDSRQIISVVDDGFTRANGGWYGQGRFLELGIWGEDENGVPLVVQWYLFDIPQGKIVGTADEDPGIKVCHTLAVSPESSRVATWCSFDSPLEEQREFTVIETDGESWKTTTPPEQVLAETFDINARHIWSPDGDYVLIPSGYNATIVYVPEPNAYQLFEDDDIYIDVFGARFSPDSKILSYNYHNCESGKACLKLIDLASRSVIWESIGLFTPPVYIIDWSPDGNFFVLGTFGNGVQIISQQDFSTAKSFSTDLTTTIAAVWQHK